MNTRGSLWNDAVMCQSQSEDTVSKAAFLKGQQHPIGYPYGNSPPAPRLPSDLDRVLGALGLFRESSVTDWNPPSVISSLS